MTNTWAVYQNLKKDNFQVLEDGVRQEITNFAAPERALSKYEEMADQFGVQYAWGAGYAPKDFITFFDKMASEKGCVRSASFFRTLPPFFVRIVSAFSEIEYLPEKKDLVTDSPEFHKIKERLKKVQKDLEADKKKRPMLRRMPECDEAKANPV
jgi:predicted Zn-dependent protease